MARQFQITAQLNLRPPDMRPIVAHIQRSLSGIRSAINVRLSVTSTRALATYAANVRQLNTVLSQLVPIANAANRSAAGLGQNLTIRVSPASNRQLQVHAQNIARLTSELNRLAPSATSAAQAMAQLSSVLTTFNTARGNFNGRASNFTVALNRTAQATRSVGVNVRDATSDMEAFGKQAALASRRFLAFSLVAGPIIGLTVGFRTAIKDALEFEREMTKVAQVTGTTVAQLQPLTDSIGQLSRQFGVSSKELVSVASTLAQAEVKLKDLPEALRVLSLTTLSPTFGDLNNTVEGFIALSGQFQLKVNQMEAALGGLNAVSAGFAVESDDLVTAVRKGGAAFRAAGGELEDLLGLFTAVRATGRESADTIAVALRTITARLQRNSTADFLKSFGINIRDAEGKFVGVFESIRRISQGIQKFDLKGPEIPAIAEEVAGIRNLSKFFSLIQNFDKAENARAAAKNGDSSLQRDSNEALKTLSAQLNRTKEDFLELFRTIVSSDTFQLLARQALNVASSIADIGRALSDLLPLFAAVAGARLFGSVSPFLGGFFGGLSRVRRTGLTPASTLGLATARHGPSFRQAATVVPQPLLPGRSGLTNSIANTVAGSAFTRVGGRNIGQFNAGTARSIGIQQITGNNLTNRIDSFLSSQLLQTRRDLSTPELLRRSRQLKADAIRGIRQGTLSINENPAGDIIGVGGLPRGALGAAGFPGQRRFSRLRARVLAGRFAPLAAGAAFAGSSFLDPGLIDGDGNINPFGVANSSVQGALTGGLLGGAAAGALSGTVLGSKAGPIGAAAGAVVGALIGLKKGLDDARAAADRFATDERLRLTASAEKNFGLDSKEFEDEIVKNREELRKKIQEIPASNLEILTFRGRNAETRRTEAEARAREFSAPAEELITQFAKEANGDVQKFRDLLKTSAGAAAAFTLQFGDASSQFVANKIKEIEAQNKAIELIAASISEYDSLILSLRQATDTVKDLAIQSERSDQLLRSSRGANAGTFSVDKISEILARPSSKLFEQTLRERGITDERFFDAGTLAKDFDKVVLETLRETQLDPNKIPEALAENLKKAGINSNILRSKIEDFAKDLLPEEGGDTFNPEDFRKSINGFVESITNDLTNPLAVNAQHIEQEGDRFIQGLASLTEMMKSVRQEQDRLGEIRLNADDVIRQVASDQQLRNIPVNVAGRNTVLDDSIKRLTGGTLNPEEIARNAEAAIRARDEELKKRLQPDDAGFEESRQKIEGFTQTIDDSEEALRRLADSSGKTANIQARLAQIQSEEAGRTNFTTGFFGSNFNERFQRLQEVGAAQFASRNLENFQNLPVMLQQAAIKGFQSLGDVGVFNGRTGNQELQRLTRQFFPGTPDQEAEKARLQQEMVQAQKDAINAQRVLIDFLRQRQDDFFTRLQQEFTDFLNGLPNRGAEGFATGGTVNGPGGVDNVPIMASAGEFIVNARQSKKHRRLLAAINSGRIGMYANGGVVQPLNGSQQMARDLQMFADRFTEAMNRELKPVRELANDIHGGANLAVQDAMTPNGPSFAQAIKDGFMATFRTGIPQFSNKDGILETLDDLGRAIDTGLFSVVGQQPDTLAEYDGYQSRMRSDPAYYYQQTGRIRVPSPYANGPRAPYIPSTTMDTSQIYAVKKQALDEAIGKTQIKKLDEIKTAIQMQSKDTKVVSNTITKTAPNSIINNNNNLVSQQIRHNPVAANFTGYTMMYRSEPTTNQNIDIGPRKNPANRPNIVGGRMGIRDARFRRARSKAYWRKVRIGAIDPRTISHDDYVFGPDQPGDLSGRQELVGGNVALNRDARRRRMGLPFFGEAERNRHNALDIPEPVPIPQWRAPWNRPSQAANPDDVLVGGHGGDQLVGGMMRSNEAFANSVNSLVQFNSGFTSSTKELSEAMKEFSRVSMDLTKALGMFTEFMKDNPIPTEIEHGGSMQFDININGAEALAAIEQGVVKVFEREWSKRMEKQYNITMNSPFPSDSLSRRAV